MAVPSSLVGRADRLQQCRRARILCHVTSSARLQSPALHVGVPEARESDYLTGGAQPLHVQGHHRAVHAGGAQIHDDDVGAGLSEAPERFPSVTGFSDDLDAWARGQEEAEALTDSGVVVYDHHPDRLGRSRLVLFCADSSHGATLAARRTYAIWQTYMVWPVDRPHFCWTKVIGGRPRIIE
jgi:hypothetical protein